jgi:hypothetical protein
MQPEHRPNAPNRKALKRVDRVTGGGASDRSADAQHIATSSFSFHGHDDMRANFTREDQSCLLLPRRHPTRSFRVVSRAPLEDEARPSSGTDMRRHAIAAYALACHRAAFGLHILEDPQSGTVAGLKAVRRAP